MMLRRLPTLNSSLTMRMSSFLGSVRMRQRPSRQWQRWISCRGIPGHATCKSNISPRARIRQVTRIDSMRQATEVITVRFTACTTRSSVRSWSASATTTSSWSTMKQATLSIPCSRRSTTRRRCSPAPTGTRTLQPPFGRRERPNKEASFALKTSNRISLRTTLPRPSLHHLSSMATKRSVSSSFKCRLTGSTTS